MLRRFFFLEDQLLEHIKDKMMNSFFCSWKIWQPNTSSNKFWTWTLKNWIYRWNLFWLIVLCRSMPQANSKQLDFENWSKFWETPTSSSINIQSPRKRKRKRNKVRTTRKEVNRPNKNQLLNIDITLAMKLERIVSSVLM